MDCLFENCLICLFFVGKFITQPSSQRYLDWICIIFLGNFLLESLMHTMSQLYLIIALTYPIRLLHTYSITASSRSSSDRYDATFSVSPASELQTLGRTLTSSSRLTRAGKVLHLTFYHRSTIVPAYRSSLSVLYSVLGVPQ